MTARPDRLDRAVTDGVATVSITNIAKRNAMTPHMWRQLPPLLDLLAVDPSVRVLILRGAGDTFCAGAHIDDLDALGDTGASADESIATIAEERLAAFPKPTLALLNGYCVGGGCQLAVACDLRFAAADTRIGIPAAKLGIVYPASTTRRLVQLIGPSAAKLLLFSAEMIDATRAAALGLVDEVVAGEAVAERVAAFARLVASGSQLSVVAGKDIVDMAAAGRLDPARIDGWHRAAAGSPDLAEGVAAFKARRQPRFSWSLRDLRPSSPPDPPQARTSTRAAVQAPAHMPVQTSTQAAAGSSLVEE